MRRALTWIGAILAALVLLLVGVGLALPFVVDTPRVQTLIASTASQALGRPVRFAAVSVALLPRPAVRLHDLEIGDDPRFGAAPFLRLQTGRLALKLHPLLSGRVEFGDLTLQEPVITLIRNADGVLNVASLGSSPEPRSPARAGRAVGGGPGGAPPATLLGRVTIEKGALAYVARGPGGALSHYRVEGLDLTLGTAGGALTFKGAAHIRPGDLAVTIKDGRVALSGGHGLPDAPLSARVTVEGRDVGELVAAELGPSPALGGSVKGTLSVSGTVGAPTATGALELAGVRVTQSIAACPEPKRRTLTLAALKLDGASWDGGRLTSRPVTLGLGGGTVRLNVTATFDRGVRVELADLSVRALPVERVLADFLCNGYAVAGPLDLDGALAFGPGDAWTTLSGPGRLRLGPGRVVGPQALALIGGVVRVGGAVSALLSADVPTALFASPLEFDSITGTYQIARGVVSTSDLLYSSHAMRVAVAGTYALATGRLNLDVVVTHGRGEVKARVTGTTASPSVRVEAPAQVRGLDREKVESGLKDLLKRFH